MVRIEIILFRNDKPLEEQHRWWLEEHAPLARKMPGLRGYVINLAGTAENDGAPDICGTDTLTFDSWEDAMTAYRSPEWNAAREHTAASGARALRTWIKDQVTIV
ncbi:MAG TPA: EthD family reductase [Candidatus Elarobacter sp.]|nr:EthD family reductase [Candidatus Elarobacter sp.]